MTNIYAMLDEWSDASAISEFTGLIEDNGGKLLIFNPPRLAIVDGDDSTVSALQQLVGSTVVALGVDDVTDLVAAADSPELVEWVGILALTTSTAVDAADLVRPYQDEEWVGFGCVVEEESE